MENVDFKCETGFIAADLYTPENISSEEQRPALVLANGFGGVKEMLAQPAEFFAHAGYVVLVIDYRIFGQSSGIIVVIRNGLGWQIARGILRPTMLVLMRSSSDTVGSGEAGSCSCSRCR